MAPSTLRIPAVVACLALACCTDRTTLLVCNKVNPAQELSKGTGTEPAEGDDLNTEFLDCKVGEFDVRVPIEKGEGERPDILVVLGGKPFLSASGGKQTIWNGASAVTAEDKNSDGSVDFLSYDTSSKGKRITTVLVDRNLDGELDSKLIMPSGAEPEMWSLIEGKWYQRVKGAESPQVLVDGIPRKCKEIDGLYVFSAN